MSPTCGCACAVTNLSTESECPVDTSHWQIAGVNLDSSLFELCPISAERSRSGGGGGARAALHAVCGGPEELRGAEPGQDEPGRHHRDAAAVLHLSPCRPGVPLSSQGQYRSSTLTIMLGDAMQAAPVLHVPPCRAGAPRTSGAHCCIHAIAAAPKTLTHHPLKPLNLTPSAGAGQTRQGYMSVVTAQREPVGWQQLHIPATTAQLCYECGVTQDGWVTPVLQPQALMSWVPYPI